MNLRRVPLILFLGVITAFLLLVLPLVILSIWISLWIIDIPNKLGKRWGLENTFRDLLYRIIDEEELRFFRDEYMSVLHPKIEYRDDIERWGLRREIDLQRERAVNDLQQGRRIIAVLGGVLTVIIGDLFGIGWAALSLSIIIIFYSVVVAFRILVVDSLAYSSIPYKDAPLRELAKMKAWNEGPLRGRGGMGVVIASLITSRDSLGSKLGMEVTDFVSDKYIEYDKDRWRDETGIQD